MLGGDCWIWLQNWGEGLGEPCSQEGFQRGFQDAMDKSIPAPTWRVSPRSTLLHGPAVVFYHF